MKYFDAHTHVQFAAFKGDCKEVTQRALDAGVFFVNVGTQKDTSADAVRIANEYERGVYAAVGLHPIHTNESYHDAEELGGVSGFVSRGEGFDFDYYKELALDPKVVAIGECGFDYYRAESGIMNHESGVRERQEDAFVKQIELAREVRKPLMLHCREAFGDLVRVLKDKKSLLLGDRPGIVHFFSGSKAEAKQLLSLGFYFTFGGVVTFVRDYDKVVKLIPDDRILSETDAPYVTPVPYRGERNEPAYVVEVVKKLAEIRGVLAEDMRAQIFENTLRVFDLKV